MIRNTRSILNKRMMRNRVAFLATSAANRMPQESCAQPAPGQNICGSRDKVQAQAQNLKHSKQAQHAECTMSGSLVQDLGAFMAPNAAKSYTTLTELHS